MCGITGIFAPPGRLDAAALQAMTDSLAHRGPDDAGVWTDPEAGVGLGHRRLSILDLSPLGRQPMASACGRYLLCFNGEVYNHLDLRRELEPLGHRFRGGSDTETMLAAIAQWGLAAAVQRFVGMFAFALWDRAGRTLHLVRDRLGIKPLYWGRAGRAVVFGSELKALRAHPDFRPEVDRDALCLYFRHNYVPAPWTIYTAARKLEPGCILTLAEPEREPEIVPYWSALDVWERGAAAPFAGDEAEAEARLEALLDEAVRTRMVADVPLGALLSGGIDSSLVVALMQRASDRPVQTFSIGFREREFNEAAHAAAVARHLGADHTELYITPKDMLDVVPRVPRLWDEPFADSSQIPTACVCALTRRHVTVALSGDGGDELFGGYQRYAWMDLFDTVQRIPRPARRALAGLARAVPPRLFGLLGAFGYKIQWRLDMLTLDRFELFYRHFLSHEKRPEALVPGGTEPESPLTRAWARTFPHRLQAMTAWDTVAYLPDDILTKTDRASMAVGLELRVPILDHRVVEFAAALPVGMKAAGGQGKRILRRLLYRLVPRELVDRPKMGFGVPVAQWLGGELRPWMNDLLDPAAIRRRGYLDADRVEDLRRRFLRGEIMWCHQLWDVLMFQAWLEEWGS
ncbi:MAG: asparagine synthase (glutamine-hydrolyzing) [Desulfovibrionaceae bacterium]